MDLGGHVCHQIVNAVCGLFFSDLRARCHWAIRYRGYSRAGSMKIGILHVKISYEFVIDHIEFIDPKEVYEVWRSQGVRHVLCLRGSNRGSAGLEIDGHAAAHRA